ncbi:hypothetical protein LQW54_001442 [Pestalotiopsis sp. IQ-011]
MDQSGTTQAYVSGMKESLSLYGNELVEFTTYFSIGYAIFPVPAQMAQTRVRPSLFLPFCEIIWGTLTLVTYRAKNAQTVLIFNWYTPKELGKRVAIFGVSGVAGNMFLGILQAALYKNLDGVNGLEGWQWLFIVSGIITVSWGFVGLVAIPNSPSFTRALYLSNEERALAHQRMPHAGATTAGLVSWGLLRTKIRLLLVSPVAYLFLGAYLQFAWSQRANSYTLLYLKGLHDASGNPMYSTYIVNLIPLGGYAISIVSNIGLNALSDWKEWRWQVACGAAGLQLVATAVLAGWPDSHPTILTFYFLTYATSAWGYALIAWLAIILRKEPEARSILVAATVTLVYVGHAIIPLSAWKTSDSPRYPIGFPMAATFSVGSTVLMLGMRYYVRKYPAILDHGLDWKSDRSLVVVENVSQISAEKNSGTDSTVSRGPI